MKSILKVMALILVALMAILLGIIFYFEFRFYLRLPFIKASDFLLFYEEFLLSALPAPFIAVLFLKGQSKIKESGSRTFLRLALGIMWILDAILQVQPEMNNLFAQYNLIPMLTMGFPVTQVIRLSVNVWNRNPPLMDLAAAVIQLYIGVLYLTTKKGKIFYFIQAVAIAWCAVIWVFGEGFGGVFTLGSSFLTGLPGSVIFYLVGAVVLILTAGDGNSTRAEKTIRYVTIATLLISLGFQVYPADGFWSSLPVNYFPSPFGFLGFAISAEIRISAFSSLLNILFVVVIVAGIVLWVFKNTYAPAVTLCFSIFAWIIYQGLGIVAQFSTDSNTGLILGILMVAYMLNAQEIKASGKKTLSLKPSAAGGM
ncbi:MAG: hypothetical protein M1327_05810 [Candidatus Thermoplasmatota archaeon]|nr:hypothetical protein [Candidatus Thermoplasmatota archaeon]